MRKSHKKRFWGKKSLFYQIHLQNSPVGNSFCTFWHKKYRYFIKLDVYKYLYELYNQDPISSPSQSRPLFYISVPLKIRQKWHFILLPCYWQYSRRIVSKSTLTICSDWSPFTCWNNTSIDRCNLSYFPANGWRAKNKRFRSHLVGDNLAVMCLTVSFSLFLSHFTSQPRGQILPWICHKDASVVLHATISFYETYATH